MARLRRARAGEQKLSHGSQKRAQLQRAKVGTVASGGREATAAPQEGVRNMHPDVILLPCPSPGSLGPMLVKPSRKTKGQEPPDAVCRMTLPKGVHVCIPETLHGKRDFADVIKDLQMER